jgi:protein SCO1
MMRFPIRAALACAAIALAPAMAPAQGTHGNHAAHPAPRQVSGNANVTVADASLQNQDGRTVHLRNDVIGDRIVVVDFVYTTCTTICPVLSAAMAQVQSRLGERSGRDVALVSISVDPARDTPAALKAYGAKFGVRDGWTLLTGAPPVVNGVLKGFGAYVADPAQHPPMVLVGDGRTGAWTRFMGLPDPAQIVARIDALQAARAHTHSIAKGQ